MKAAELNWICAQWRDKFDLLDLLAHGAQAGFGTYGYRVAAPGSV